MACNTIEGILKGCEDSNSGGIYTIYIQDTDSVTWTADVSAHTLTTLTATTDFQTFQFNRNTGSANVSEKIDLINGSTYFEATLSIVLNRHTAAKHRAITILGQGQRFVDVIVTDANNVNWFYDHAQLTANEATTGVAKADGQKYTLTFVAQMDNLPYEVSDALLAGVTA